MDSAPSHQSKVIFAASGKSTALFTAMIVGIPTAVAIAIYLNERPLIDKITVVILAITIVGLLAWFSSSSRVMKIDTRHRRIRMTSWLLGEREQTVFDVSFDQCDGVGVERRSDGEGPDTYHLYLQLRGGEQHEIPANDSSAEETLARLIAVTKLKRIDGAPDSAGYRPALPE